MVRLWENTDHPYLEALNRFALHLATYFPDAEVAPVGYSGGVPGMQAVLPGDRYDRVRWWLDKVMGGTPEGVRPWHKDQDKTAPPLRYRALGKSFDHVNFDHVNLILLVNGTVLVTWM